MGKKKTHEQFIEEMKIKHPNIKVIGVYQGANKKIDCECLIDGHKWKATPHNLLGGETYKPKGCPKCSGNAKKTHEEFIEELNEINSNIEVLGEYKNNSTKVSCKCKICNHEWKATPSNLLGSKNTEPTKCPKCNGGINKTHEEFIEELNEINSNIEVLGEYKNSHTKIPCHCKICDYEWSPTPTNLLSNKGCPMCAIENFKGENNPNYNPNLTDEEREANRDFKEYNEWRISVYKRDNYTCQCCGSHKSGTLNAHHKDGYNWCIERRTDIANGVTLCEDCHKSFHSIYGYGNNTEQQFEEFINNNNNNNIA